MLAILSPAKSLDLESKLPAIAATQPRLLADAERLICSLRRHSRSKLRQIMSISENLAELNYQRYQEWEAPFTESNARPAIYTFDGDVYTGLDARTLSLDEVRSSQEHLRILSGLYGLLRPLDLMQPYRLEMGCDFKPPRYSKLTDYWKPRLKELLKQDLEGHAALVNLASNEYAAAVDFEALGKPVIKVDFKEEKEGELRVLSFFAKQARGLMARHIVQQRADSIDDLRSFTAGGYTFRAELSSREHLIFARPQP